MLRFALAAAALLTPVAVAAQDAPKPLLTWPDLVEREKPAPDATVDYGTDPYQKVDVWVPQGKGPFPTVLMVHGGCWTTSIADRSLMNWIADDLRKDGVAVWNVDYRGVDRPGGGYPGTFTDAAAAADALKANARKYHLDAKHVVAVGHSAGGHLALWLAGRGKIARTSPLYTRSPLKIAHAISLGGLPDLKATAASPDNGCGVEVVGKLVGAPGSRHDVYADTSVPRLLPIGVAQDLVNGQDDKIIPLRMGTDYVAAARAKGDSAELHIVEQTGHVELVAPETAAWATTKRLIREALAK
jgi:acetyl esterase/lipase